MKDRAAGMRYLFWGIFVTLSSCSHYSADLCKNMQGAFADSEKKTVAIITPVFLIRVAKTSNAIALKNKLSPYWGVKKYYHIIKKCNSLIIQSGPDWSVGGEAIEIVNENKLRTGNLFDRGGVMHRISLEEAQHLLKKFGYDVDKINETPPFPLKHYYRTNKKKNVLYDSFTGKSNR